MFRQQLVLPESVWQFVAKTASESECHCKCGETFLSLACYIGKKTGSVSQLCCPSCGSYHMEYVLSSYQKIKIPDLGLRSKRKTKKV